MSDYSPEQAKEILEKITGPEGLAALSAEVKRSIENRKVMRSKIDGEIAAFENMSRLLEILLVKWGLKEGEIKEKSIEEPKKVNDFNEEKEQRIKDNKCLFRSEPNKGKKWCERKLRTKAEKESGYCKIHMRELGLLEDA